MLSVSWWIPSIGSAPPGRAVLATAATVASVALALLWGVRFDGALDVHVGGGSVPLATAAVDLIVAWPLVAAALWLAARATGRPAHPLDLLAGVAIARAVQVAVAAVALQLPLPEPAARIADPPPPGLLAGALLLLPLLAWFLVLLYGAYVWATGGERRRTVGPLIATVVASEVVSKLLLLGLASHS